MTTINNNNNCNITIINNPVRYACMYDGCEKDYSTKNNLKQHIDNFHKEIKKFTCNICGYKCNHKSTIRRHKENHENIKKYSCDIEGCGYICNEGGDLIKHSYKHTNIKKYSCDNGCKYKTSLIENLKRHQKTCTGKSKLSYSEFTTKNILDDHMVDFYRHNESHHKLTEFCGKALKIDFFFEKEGYKPLILELNGRQHDGPVKFGGISMERAKKNFVKQKIYDQHKRNFAKEFDYNMIEVHHTDFNNLWDIIHDLLVEYFDWDLEDYL